MSVDLPGQNRVQRVSKRPSHTCQSLLKQTDTDGRTDKERERERERRTDIQKDRQTERERERDRDKQTQTATETETGKAVCLFVIYLERGPSDCLSVCPMLQRRHATRLPGHLQHGREIKLFTCFQKTVQPHITMFVNYLKVSQLHFKSVYKLCAVLLCFNQFQDVSKCI